MKSAEAIHLLRLALVQAVCAIKGREHTGFITKALVATEVIDPEPAPKSVARLKVMTMPSGMRVIELSALAAAHELPEGQYQLTAATPFPLARIQEIAAIAAVAVGKNASVAEQLCFPHIYLTLLDHLHELPAAAPEPSSQTESPP